MKLIHFITSMRQGGAERLVASLLPEMLRAGHEVQLWLMDDTHSPLLDEVERLDVKVCSLGHGAQSMHNPLLLPRLLKLIRRENPDLIHTHNTACQLLAAMASAITPTRLMTTEHSSTNRRREWRWFRGVDRWMYGRYERIVCVSQDVEEALNGYLPQLKDKTRVIANGIDLQAFRQAAPEAEVTAMRSRKVMMVAAFRKQKDQPTLIRAMQWLPDDYRLLLVGERDVMENGARDYMAECRTLTEQLGLGARVVFMGLRGDVPALLAAADVVVMSSHYEGLPLSAIEAMASGKPVVASDVPGLREVAGGAALLFPEGDDRSLAALIRRMAEDTEEARRVVEHCQARAAHYDVRETARQYLEMYSEINKS